MPIDPITCLNCRRNVAHSRGVCGACYDKLRYLVRRGKATWAELEQAGRCLAAAGTPWRGRKKEE